LRDDSAEYAIPTSNSYPTCLDIDSQKRLWFVESQPNKLGMFDTASNSFREFPTPTIDGLRSTLNRIAVDGDDNVWLTDTANGRLIKYYPAKNVSVPVYVGDKKSYPTFLSIDNDGNIWVVESGDKKLAKVNADSLYGLSGMPTLTLKPTPTPAATNQTATATAKPSPGFEYVAGVLALLIALCLALRKK
jgi:streptogramin lyase